MGSGGRSDRAAADLDCGRVRTRRFGDTDLEASEIGFGTWALGSTWWGEVSEQAGERLLLEALDLGITFFETGDAYGQGANEELVGRVLGPHRDRIQLSTKFGYVLDRGRQEHSEGERPQRWDGPFVRRGAGGEPAAAAAPTIVDLYQLHNPRLDAIDSDECFATLEELRAEGKIAPIRRRPRPRDRLARGGPASDRHARDRLRADRLQPARAGPRPRLHGGRRRARRRRDRAGPDLVGPARRQPDAGDDLRPRRPPPPPAARVAGRGPRRRSSGSASSAGRRRAARWPRRRCASSSPSRR